MSDEQPEQRGDDPAPSDGQAGPPSSTPSVTSGSASHGLPSIVPRAPHEGLDDALEALMPSRAPAALDGEPAPVVLSQDKERTAQAGTLADLPPGTEVEERAEDGARPDPLSAVFSRPETAHDPGAQAAYRSIPRHSPAELRLPLLGTDREAQRGRAALLEHLAQSTRGSARAELLTAAAEQWQRTGEPARAKELYENAHQEDPRDLVVVRELRRQALAESDFDRVRELLLHELELPLEPQERASCWLLIAEVALSATGDREAAEHAAEQSFEQDPNVGAGLLLYELHTWAGRHKEAAEALRAATESWPDAKAQGGLLLEAGHLLLAADEPARALTMFERAQSADPELLDAGLCCYRAARAAGDARAALSALERIGQSFPENALSEDALRLRARLLEARGNAAEALSTLAPTRGSAGLRLRARLAEKGGDRAQQRAALEGYTEAVGGSERALGLLGLAELDAASGDFPAAARALRQAAAADGRLGLVRTMQTALGRASGDSASFAPAAEDAGTEDMLEAAARVARDARGNERELSLLSAARLQSRTAALLALDVACELGSWPEVVASLVNEVERVAPAQRLGVELALLDVREAHGLGPGAALTARDAAPYGASFALLHRIHEEREPRALGALWLELSAQLRSDPAAAAATLAGDYLARFGAAREAYERALAAAPGHAPSCWELEHVLSSPEDLSALQRVHTALARASADPLERAARLMRLSLLQAEAPAEAAARFREAMALSPADALLCDRALGMEDGSALVLAEILEDGGHSAGGVLASLAKLRAAAFYEEKDEPARAAVLYREVLDLSHGEDPHAALGLERALAQAGLTTLLVEHLERTAQQAPSSARAELLERLALLRASIGDERQAMASWRALLDVDEQHVGALRATQRHAMERGDLERLAFSAERLSRRAGDPHERAAQLRLLARAADLRGRPLIQLDDDAADLGLWHAISLERSARARGDALATARAVLRMCDAHLVEPNERASHAMGAAAALEPVSPARAAKVLLPYVEAAPSHTLAQEALGRLLQAAGDLAGAARAYERAALASPSPLRTARQWYRAALLWQEAVGDDAHARTALEAVVAIDVLHRDAFSRLHRLLSAAQDLGALCALIETRIMAGGPPRTLSDLHLERSRLSMRLGQRPVAKLSLKAALLLDPGRLEALRAVADLHMQSGEWREAAEALIRIARLTEDRAALRETFMALGGIYTEQLPDLRRAEIAYARAVGLDPNDVAAVERLLHVFLRKREYDKALRACERLLDLARDDAEVDRRTVELASVLEDKGERLRAERALNDLREQRPGSSAIIMALCDLYARQRDQSALTVHLDRSIHALRAGILTDPSEASRWNALCEVLSRRGRTYAAQCVAALASDLGLADERAEQLAIHVHPLAIEAFTPASVQRLWPDDLNEAGRNLLTWLEQKGQELLPDDERGERLTQLPPVLQRALEEARGCADMSHVALAVAGGSECVAFRGKPIVLRVGRQLIDDCDADELAFLLLRAWALTRVQLSLGARSEPSELSALLAAATEAIQPQPEPTQPRAETKLSQRQAKELSALAEAADVRNDLDAAKLRALALQAGARLALVAQGSISAALTALGACETVDEAPDYEGHDLLSALSRSAQARDLLHFALSDAHLELRGDLESPSQS